MKKVNYLIISILIMANIGLNAQDKGVISTMMLQNMRQEHENHTSATAITNALSNGNVKNLALNRANLGKTDHHFKYKVEVKGITDQKSSGRCWMFTGLNVLRPKIIDKYKLDGFEFSTNYLYFFDILEKSNLFVNEIINTAQSDMDEKRVEWLFRSPVGDGGVWNSLSNLVEKYGLVPKQVMPESKNSENTRMMIRLIRRKLREDGLELRKMYAGNQGKEKLNLRKNEMLAEIYHILALNLGQPPTEFEYRFVDKDKKIGETKKYTPLSFFHFCLPNVDFDEYVMLMNDPSRPYHKLYEIDMDRNVMEGRNWKYINLPNDEIKMFALESIKKNEAMYSSCDVGKQLNKDAGLLATNNYDYEALYGISFGMDKQQRIITRESGSSHGMALMAVDVDENEKPVKWQVENSWGIEAGHKGYLTITDEWFDEYFFRVVILKKFIDAKTLKILEQEATLLPPWDPMFGEDE